MNMIDVYVIFFFNDTATTEIYTLSLHDALPILQCNLHRVGVRNGCDSALHAGRDVKPVDTSQHGQRDRSEEHTSELQSRQYLVCRLLLEKKKTYHISYLIFSQHILKIIS